MRYTEEQVNGFINNLIVEGITAGRGRGYELMCEAVDHDITKANILSECTSTELVGAILESCAN